MIVYLNMRPSIQWPLFCNLNGKFLTRYQFHSILSAALRFLNYDVQKKTLIHLESGQQCLRL
jgi:hypothetical protein